MSAGEHSHSNGTQIRLSCFKKLRVPQSFSEHGKTPEVFSGAAFGGVDHIFSSCTKVLTARNLGLDLSA